MTNVNTFTGSDGSVTLSSPSGAEGDAANTVLTAYDTISVGRVQDVHVEVTSQIKAYHEIGQRYATELRPGNVIVRGTIGRAYLNGAMLKLLLGEAGDARPQASWVQPAFNITLLVENAARPGVRSTLTLHNVMIENWAFALPEQDFVLESVGFQALFITVADEG
jgi:hypothetical protein